MFLFVKTYKIVIAFQGAQVRVVDQRTGLDIYRRLPASLVANGPVQI